MSGTVVRAVDRKPVPAAGDARLYLVQVLALPSGEQKQAMEEVPSDRIRLVEARQGGGEGTSAAISTGGANVEAATGARYNVTDSLLRHPAFSSAVLTCGVVWCGVVLLPVCAFVCLSGLGRWKTVSVRIVDEEAERARREEEVQYGSMYIHHFTRSTAVHTPILSYFSILHFVHYIARSHF